MPEKVVEGNRKSRRPRRDSRPRLSGRSQLDIRNRYPRQKISVNFDARLRLFIYRHLIAKCRAPSIAEMARHFKSQKHLDVALQRLCASHAFVLQENGDLWRAAPFSAVPTAFPVKVGIVLIMATASGMHSASLQCLDRMPGLTPPAAAAIWKCC